MYACMRCDGYAHRYVVALQALSCHADFSTDLADAAKGVLEYFVQC